MSIVWIFLVVFLVIFNCLVFLKLFVQGFFCCFFLIEGCRPGAQTQKKAGATRVGGPKGAGEAKISHFFFSLSRRKIRSFLLSGGLLVEFWWCF